MGLIRSSLSFSLGTMFGVYIAQNYNVPNIQTLFNTGYSIAKHMEEQYRKPGGSKGGNGDDSINS